MLTLTSTLQAAIGHPRRKPAIAASVQPYRFNVPVLTASWLGANGSADTQLSLAVKATDRTKLVAVRSNGTALDFSTPYPSGAWTNLDTISAGQGFQLAYDPTAAVFAVAYGDGTALKFRTSADGLTWSAATTIVTEASNIGAVALAFDDSGDACVFYVIGTSTTLNRIRRTAGTWAASGTNWTRSSSVANLTGLAAAIDVGRHLVHRMERFGLFYMAVYTRLTRASMLEVADQDFVKTARAKGVPEGRILRAHVLRNALLPVITFAGIQAGHLLGGSIVVETVFAWPGIGRLAFDALLARDYNLLLGVFFCTSVMVVVFNIVTDLLYALIDPRIEVTS